MQRFVRSKVPPSVFRGKKFSEARQALLEFFLLEQLERSQTRFSEYEQDLDLQSGPIHDALGLLFHGKCAFCETEDLTLPYRFRPGSAAISARGELDSHLYYTWLSNAWENIYPICLRCVPRQPSYFPVRGSRATLPSIDQIRRYVDEDFGSWGAYPPREIALLLDPCIEKNFEKHLFPSVSGRLLPLSEKGDITIANFLLDRPELSEAREVKLREYREKLLAFSENISQVSREDFLFLFDFAKLEFGGLWYLQCRRIALYLSKALGKTMRTSRSKLANTFQALFRFETYRQERGRLKNWIEVADFGFNHEDSSEADMVTFGRAFDAQDPTVPPMYPSLVSIELHNFKVIERLKLELVQRRPESLLSNVSLQPALLILGENATGKSSILEATALALSAPATCKSLKLAVGSLALNPARLGSESEHPVGSAKVYLGFDEGPDITLEIDGRIWKQSETHAMPPVFAYGAFRQYQKNNTDYQPAHTIINLFRSDRLLPNPEEWLLGLEGEDLNNVARALKIIMSVEGDIKVIEKSPDGRCCLIVTAPAEVVTKTPLNDVSSGYRTILAMVCDIMRRLMDPRINSSYQSLEHAQAVVLIDEVEAHLHPRWKIQIMHVLRKALPKVTFIATSHDPLCLRGMKNGEVVVVQRRSRSEGADTQYAACVEQLVNLPDCAQLTIEQLLMSDFFNLISTDQPEKEIQLANFADLLSKLKKNESLSDQEQRVMKHFEEEINTALPIGTSEAQRLVQEAVAEFLQRRHKEPSTEWATIRAEAKNQILKILEGF